MGTIAASPAQLQNEVAEDPVLATADKAAPERGKIYAAIEERMRPITERATGVLFEPKLAEGLYLGGAGVRKKAIVNVYAVAMYTGGAIGALSSIPKSKKKDAQTALYEAAKTFGPTSPTTTLVLEMVFKADGKAIGEALADGIKPRFNGSTSSVTDFLELIVEGLKEKGGRATKGTVFRFDCDREGIEVSVDGRVQGKVAEDGLGSAFVGVFLDDKAVSQQLIDSCLETWCSSGI